MAEAVELKDLLQQWREEAGPDAVCLDLGCGQKPTPGFIGVDICDGADWSVDLFSTPWHIMERSRFRQSPGGAWSVELHAERIPDDFVDLVYATHFLEHVPDFNQFFVELYRVMKHGALAVFQFPYLTSFRAWQDPTHKQYLSEQRFWYLSPEFREKNKIDHYLADVNFQEAYEPWFEYTPPFAMLSDDAKAHARYHSWNAVSDCVVFLRCIKDNQPTSPS